ncbi:phage tail tube protein [Bacillus horti]|uniref:Secreted protein n=1 Tax=Caldalkalibacillus horti TaxID=77523 RepID=A0ABT9W5C7_9BACI|nr:phage tail tube protein [Bacillus horti]MDQ0168449.1 putative secreted protein [Bacillus horti]
MALAGRKLKVNVSTDGTSFSEVLQLNEATMTNEGDNQDVSTFGSDFIQRLQGLKDSSYSLNGFYDPSNTAGQVAIRDAWLNNTPLYVQFLPDGESGFEQEVKVSSYEVTASAEGTVEVAIEVEGSGAISAV